MADYFMAWWNVENLFDIEHAPDRPEAVERKVGKDLKGWTEAILSRKIDQLASIINQLNNGDGPDILGVCEVENAKVLQRLVDALNLPNRNYDIAHHDSPDQRGIDVAFIYDSDRFEAVDQFSHFVLRRTATRDLFQVNFKTKPGGKELRVIGNHWPSRSAGEAQSQPYRMIAGETLGYWMHRITDAQLAGANAAVIAMGDFNDEPFNRSLMEYANSTNDASRVTRARSVPYLFNLMWPFLAEGIGTHYYNSTPNVLDQFMVSKGVVNGESGFSLKRDADGNPLVKIEMFDEMRSGGVPDPIRFNLGGENDVDKNGFSDHYPISMIATDS